MHVSLAPLQTSPPGCRGDQHRAPPTPLLTAGPRVVLGGQATADGLVMPIVPRADTLFGPRGACLAREGGPLFVCDTGHHRLLVWTRAPTVDHAPADIVIGQLDFGREGRNAKGEPGAATLNVPTGIAVEGDVLAVADAWNHRVLLWHGLPQRTNRPADIVVGQADLTGHLANRGAAEPTAATLNWCYSVALADGRLIVADTGNRRVLVWDHVPTNHGASADLVLGQVDTVGRDENAGAAAGANGMRWPHGLAVLGATLLVADAGNNRIMVWRRFPQAHGSPCDLVLGQADMAGVDHNRAAYLPTASTLNMPYALAVQADWLVVADTANSRLLGFVSDDLTMGAPATRLAGQRRFTDKGDNRWGPPLRDSLCWPYGVAACGDDLVVADTGNNRVLLWEAAT